MSKQATKQGMLSSLWYRTMPNEDDSEQGQHKVYEIRLQGHLNHRWMDWFEGLVITLEEDGSTLLTGPVVDQAALHGLLKKVRDLGMVMISVNSAGSGLQNTSQTVTHE